MLNRPVLELAVEGSARGWAPAEYLAGNEAVQSAGEAEEAILRYLAGRPIPDEQQRARQAFLTDCFGPQDGRAAVRCAERIAELVSPESRSEADRARTREAVCDAVTAAHTREEARLSSRFKRAFAIPESVPLRFWKRRRSDSPVTAEREVTPEMVSGLHARFDRLPVGPDRKPRHRV